MTLRHPLQLAGSALVMGGLLAQRAALAETPATNRPLLVYIGTYSGPRSKGIYLSRLDQATGKLSVPELAAEARNPTFLAVHPNLRTLYAVGEMSDFGGKKEGAVSSFSLDAKTGKLALLKQQPSGGGGPCHLSVVGAGRFVLVANYGTGSIAALPVQMDGQLGPPAAVIQHTGSSVNPQRQAGPHAHFVTADPANQYALACDLGLDQVLVYRLALRSVEPLVRNEVPPVAIKPGSGPRHLAFHPSGRFVYLINEMGSTLTALTYNTEQGSLKEFQTVSTLPEKFKGDNTCAEVQVHPSGKFVYGSNRGHVSIAAFAVNPDSGRLTYIENQPTQGKTPRHFAIDPSGQWLLAENQASDNIVVFRIDAKTGKLTPTGQVVEVGGPVCAVFVKGE